MICNIYIETSIVWPKHGDGIVGIIFADEKGENGRPLFGVVKDSSENAAVLFGIKNALLYAQDFETIHLHLSGNIGYNFKYLTSWSANGFQNSKGQQLKHAELWQEIDEKSRGKSIIVHTNEFNGYRNWLKAECDKRGLKHGFTL